MTVLVWMSSTKSLHVVIGAHANSPPADAEWKRYLGTIEATLTSHPEATRGLTFTDGAVPSILQRGALNRILSGRNIPVAVVSESTLVRTVITALGWFNADIRAFEPTELFRACEHLGVSTSDRRSFLVELSRLSAVWPHTHALRKAVEFATRPPMTTPAES